MRALQVGLALLVLVSVGVFNFRASYPAARIIPDPESVATVVLGNSHSNSLLYDSNFDVYYLNRAGVFIKDKKAQIEFALSVFDNLDAAFLDIAPIEFTACEQAPAALGGDTLISNTNNLSTLLVNAKSVIKMTVVDPRVYLTSHPTNFPAANGKIPVPDFSSGYFGIQAQYTRCLQASESDIEALADTLYESVSLLDRNNVDTILVIPPHHPQYLEELSRAGVYDAFEHAVDYLVQRLQTSGIDFCVVDMIDFEVEQSGFYDGDHLNSVGQSLVAPALHENVCDCLSKVRI